MENNVPNTSRVRFVHRVRFMLFVFFLFKIPLAHATGLCTTLGIFSFLGGGWDYQVGLGMDGAYRRDYEYFSSIFFSSIIAWGIGIGVVGVGSSEEGAG